MITVRLATLADTAAITAIHQSHKTVWERYDAQGQPVSVPYSELTLYERWQQGGPWVSIETCAVHLNRLLAGSGMPLVAEIDGQVRATAEVYEGFEPAPFGHHLNLAAIITHADYAGRGLGTALLRYIAEMARLMKCERLTVSHADGRDFYIKQGFRLLRSGVGVRIPAQAGRAFYQASELTDRNPEQIKNWHMPLGHYQSARQEWEKLFPQDWAAGVPEILNIATAHLKLTVTGQNLIVFTQESDQPGEVHLSCWAARPLSNPILTALRDRAHRDGYHTLVSYVLDSDLPLLGSDVQQTDYTQDHYELPL